MTRLTAAPCTGRVIVKNHIQSIFHYQQLVICRVLDSKVKFHLNNEEEKINKYFAVSVSVIVHAIENIHELNNYWKVKAVFELVWTDERLKMQNLRKNNNRNLLTDKERSLIWIPEVMFSNNQLQNRLVVDSKPEVSVNRTQTQPTISRYEDLNNALIYNGKQNSMVDCYLGL